MKQAVLSQFNLPWLPLTGLVLFCVCFGVYVFYTYKKSNKEYYDQAAFIPLEDSRKQP